jgi:hypothetical protein
MVSLARQRCRVKAAAAPAGVGLEAVPLLRDRILVIFTPPIPLPLASHNVPLWME